MCKYTHSDTNLLKIPPNNDAFSDSGGESLRAN